MTERTPTPDPSASLVAGLLSESHLKAIICRHECVSDDFWLTGETPSVFDRRALLRDRAAYRQQVDQCLRKILATIPEADDPDLRHILEVDLPWVIYEEARCFLGLSLAHSVAQQQEGAGT